MTSRLLLPFRRVVDALSANEVLNFVVTNRIPRRAVTVFMGWFSRIEQPLVRDASIRAWRWLDPSLRLDEARKTTFNSLHDCFIRELREGARPIDRTPLVLVSPCDAIVGAHGEIRQGVLVQAKDEHYLLGDLLRDHGLAAAYLGGTYVTLRLTSAMYHRFHAPADGEVSAVTYVPGDVWNVNPPALQRVSRLFCRNERAIVALRTPEFELPLLLVAVAAILVGSIRLHALGGGVVRARGPQRRECIEPVVRGQELGWFEHGSTIIVIAPSGVRPCASLRQRAILRMGEPLLTIDSGQRRDRSQSRAHVREDAHQARRPS